MLVLSRQQGESLNIGDDITITILASKGPVRVGIDAPKSVAVHRQEVTDRIKAGSPHIGKQTWHEYMGAFIGEAAMRELRRRYDAGLEPGAGEERAADFQEEIALMREDWAKLSGILGHDHLDPEVMTEYVATIRNAVVQCIAATRAYMPPNGISPQAVTDRVVAATDNPAINKAMGEVP